MLMLPGPMFFVVYMLLYPIVLVARSARWLSRGFHGLIRLFLRPRIDA